MTKRQRSVAQVVISLVLLIGLLLWVDLAGAIRALKTASIPLMVAAFLLITFNRILMPLKWNLLLRASGVRCSWGSAIRIYYISSFLGLYLPPTVGQDAVRAYYVARQNNPLRAVVSSIFVERLLGLIALLFFALVGGILFLTIFREIDLEAERILGLVLVLTVVLISGFLVSLSGVFRRGVQWAVKVMRGYRGLSKVAEKLGRLYESYFGMKRNKLTLFAFFFLTCLEVTLPIVRSHIIGRALGVSVPLLYYFAFVPIILVLIRLPISLDGFGIHEGGFVYFLSRVGVDGAVGFSVGLLNHLIFLVAVLPGWYFYANNKERRELVREAEASALSNSE